MKAFPLKELSDFQKVAGLPETLTSLPADLFRSPRRTPTIQRQHSQLVDRILGINMNFEARLANSQGKQKHWQHEEVKTWVGLDPQTLNTPYALLREICLELKLTRERVVDLGSGIGRLGLVLHQMAPNARFLGLEYVAERVIEANRVYERWGCKHARSEQADLLSKNFQLPEADVYFIYDYGEEQDVRATLQSIIDSNSHRRIRIVGRGAVTTRLLGQSAGCSDYRVLTIEGRQKTPTPWPLQNRSTIGA